MEEKRKEREKRRKKGKDLMPSNLTLCVYGKGVLYVVPSQRAFCAQTMIPLRHADRPSEIEQETRTIEKTRRKREEYRRMK